MGSIYLHPWWRDLRAKVIHRSAGKCEVCRVARAVHVHHCSYAKGKKGVLRLLVPLRELKAVCLPCHERIHGKPIKPAFTGSLKGLNKQQRRMVLRGIRTSRKWDDKGYRDCPKCGGLISRYRHFVECREQPKPVRKRRASNPLADG